MGCGAHYHPPLWREDSSYLIRPNIRMTATPVSVSRCGVLAVDHNT